VTKTIYQVQGKEYATEPEARAHLVSIVGEPVRNVDWLNTTSIQDAANGIKRLVAGIVNRRVEDTDELDDYLARYR
jgi:hypothetical protein